MSAPGKWNFAKYLNFSRMTNSARLAIREWRGTRHACLHAFWFLVTVALLVYLGPFGTWASLPVSERLPFWMTTVGANWIAGSIVFRVMSLKFRARGWPAWVGFVLAALTAALPGTGTVWLVVTVYLDYRPASVPDVVRLYAQVAVLHLIIGTLVLQFIEGRLRRPDARETVPPPDASTQTASQPAPEAALLARLPARSRAELLHLRMQDHYVEVHTAAGSELLLLRFRDALREVEGVDGLQVHRSHWVAREAVVRIERRGGGRVSLRLVNGSRVPVSRSFVPSLRSQGWI